MATLESPKVTASLKLSESTVWLTATVNATGPIENGGLYIMLTGQDVKNTWFYVQPAISALVNETAIAAIVSNKKAYVEVSGTTPGSVISRFHLLA